MHRSTPARRQAILEAALQCFLDRGYESTTMAQVSAAAGASIGSLYHHYAGKEDLAVALYSEALVSYHHSWLGAIHDAGATEPAVRGAVHAHFHWLSREQSQATVLFGHPVPGAVARHHPDVARLNAAFTEKLLGWIKPRVSSGELAHLPDDVYQPLWLGPAQELTRSYIGYKRLGDLAVVAPELARAAWEGLHH